MEGLMDGTGQLVDIGDEVIVLGAAARDARRVGFLEGVRADQVCRHLAGDDDHRDRIHHRIGDRRDHVGRAGAGGDQRHAALAGGAGIAFGGMARALFMAHQDVADVVGGEQRVIDWQDGAARIPKHDLYALFPEGRDYDLGAGHQAGFGLLFGFDGHDLALASEVRKEGFVRDVF